MKERLKILKMIAVVMSVILMLEQASLLNVLAAEDTDTTEVALDETETEVDTDSEFAVEEENEDSDDYSRDSDSENSEEKIDNSEGENASDDDCDENSDEDDEDIKDIDEEVIDIDSDSDDNSEELDSDLEDAAELEDTYIDEDETEEIEDEKVITVVNDEATYDEPPTGFVVRNTPPTDDNTFYSDMPNCTSYVIGRVYEVLGSPLVLRQGEANGNAGEYYQNAQMGGWEISSDASSPKVGAIVCYFGTGDYSYGHVQYVEEIGEDGKGKYICVSESNYSGRYSGNEWKKFNFIKIYTDDLNRSKDTGKVLLEFLEDSDGYSEPLWKGYGEPEKGNRICFQGYIYTNVETEPAIAVTDVEIEEGDYCLFQGDSFQLHSTISPLDATDQRLEWVSSATSVATVDENGLVTALSPGEATITVRSLDGSGKSDSVIITVEETAQSIPVSTITLSHSSIDLVYGQAQTITAIVSPDDATNKSLSWKSDDENIVRVFGNGILIAGFVEGSATVTAEAADGSGIKTECTVNVTAGEDDIEVSDYFSAIGAADIRSYDAVLFARLSEPMNITEYGVYIGTENSVEDCEKIRMSSLTEVNDIRFSVSKVYGNLTEQTTYYYRFYIITDDIEYYSALGSFKTISSSDDPSEAPMEKRYQRGDIINYGRRAYGYTSWVPKDIQSQLKGASQGFYEVQGSTYYSNGSNIYCTIPARWIVLEDEGDSLLVISEYVFEGTAFDSSTSTAAKNWENSEIREYLNSGYMAKMFTTEEMNDIYITPVAAEGIITYDKLFLPSYDELMEYFDNNDQTKAHYYADLTPRITTPISGTGNALAYDKTNYTCAYWTRSSNHTNYGWSQPTYVDCNGAIRWGGRVYNTWNSGIRPMMKIDASSEYISTALTVDNVPEAFEQETIVLETGEYDISGSLSWDELGYPISYRWKANGSGALNSPQFVYFGENTLEASLYGILPEAVIQQQYIVGICSPDSIRVRRSGPNDEENGVILNWEREADSRNGCGVFEILRSTTPDGDYEQIYQGVVDYSSSRVSDSSVRYSYSYVDTTAEPGGEYWYKVRRLFSEWVSIGKYNYSSESHGYVQECSQPVFVGNYMLGDVNNDGKVNAADRIYLARYLAGWSGYVIENEAAADVNCDNKVNAADRIYLARYLAGWSGYSVG